MRSDVKRHRRATIGVSFFVSLNVKLAASISCAALFFCFAAGGARAQGAPDVVWTGSASSTVNAVAYAPDGLTVLSGQADKNSTLWGAGAGTALRTFFSASGNGCGGTNSVAYSPDGRTAASATGCDVRLWRVSDGSLIRVIANTTGANSFQQPTAVAFSPDGVYVATRSEERRVGKECRSRW